MLSTFVLTLALIRGAAAATTIPLTNPDGKNIGTATLTALANGVKIDVVAKGLSPGEHAIHIHEHGKCDAPKFESAGGHFAPNKNPHGFDDAKGPHAGDMPNLVVAADGTVKAELINVNVSLNKGEAALVRPGGTALIIHEKADDYKTQPTGNAGGRMACGVIAGS